MNAIQTIKLFANDEEFIKQVMASLHVASENANIRKAALDAFIQIDKYIWSDEK